MVWATGARGMLGVAIGTQLDRHGIPWFSSDLEVDIADPRAVRQYVAGRSPTVIFNCAAYTAVDAAETDEAAARRANGEGPEVLAGLAHELGALLVHISTDYVFDGTLPRGQAYREDDQTCPSNAYGRTKLLGEQGIARAFVGSRAGEAGGWLVLRTSWLFGTGRSSFVDTMWRLMLEKEGLRVVSDQVGRPTYVGDLADAMIAAAGLTGRSRLSSGIWHYANTGAVSWHAYASTIRDEMLVLGQPVTVEQIQAVPSEEFPRPATRPKNSVLDTGRIEQSGVVSIRPWQAALHEYLHKRHQACSK